MADDKTACKVGGHNLVFKKKVKAGDKLSAKDIETIDGSAPGESLPRSVSDFLTGVAGKAI